VPNRVDQFVLGDDPVAILNEVNQQIEHLRLDVNNDAGAPQLLPLGIDLEIGEAEVQGNPLVAATDSSSLPRADLSNSRALSEGLPHTALQEIFRESPKRFRAGWSSASSLSSRRRVSPRSAAAPIDPCSLLTRLCIEANLRKDYNHGD
jgi:hypothetical protein